MPTLPAALETTAARRPDRGFTFSSGGRAEQALTFPVLRDRAAEVAAALVDRGMRRGDRVALALADPESFVVALLGIQGGGGVPVPLPTPAGFSHAEISAERTREIVRASGARLVIAPDGPGATPGQEANGAPRWGAPGTETVAAGALVGHGARRWDPALRLDDLALIQFTSGSVTRPKGVAITYANVAANCRAILHEGLAVRDGDRHVSWLPLHHDMGLIGPVFCPIHEPLIQTTLMPATAFFRRPSRWLQTLSRAGGTWTYAPTFAYALVAYRIRDEETAGLDLSALRVAGVGAEPIHPETLRAFARRYAPYGFRERAFAPSYGMAESTLAIAIARGLRVERVRAAALAERGVAEVVPDTGDEPAVELVSCGGPLAGHHLKIAEPASGAALAERQVGEIWVRGPSVMQGYFDQPAATRSTITHDGYLRTGDLGYLADGRLYVCGRAKDIIVVRGSNHYPHDIEGAAQRVDGVRLGGAIAFGVDQLRPGGERVVVAVETRQRDDRSALAARIRSEIQRRLGLVVDEVLLLPPRSIPKTPNGKLRRSEARALYEAGAWRPAGGAPNPPTSSRDSSSAPSKASISSPV